MSNYLSRSSHPGNQYPEKIIQFGEGNFLRAFIDWMIDILNEKTDFNSGVTVIRPIDTKQTSLNEQDGLYTAIIRGLNEQGEAVAEPRLIRSVNREISVYQQFNEYLKCAENPELQWVFSNTTEAGIAFNQSDSYDDKPPSSFPAKLTRFLHHRYSHFSGAADKGLIIVPCELIDYNGEQLKKFVLQYAEKWQLGAEFISWLNDANTFCSTLVDRIVTGYPRDEVQQIEEKLGYRDRFIVTAEYFYLFVMQGPQWLKSRLKLDKVDLNIRIVDDIKPYKERKVSILNGAHTAMVPVAYLMGHRTVGDAMKDPLIARFVYDLLYDEVIPTLSLDKTQLEQFAKDVLDRFRNPYIRHELLSIALNSLTKFKTRLLPQLLNYQRQFNRVPSHITFALAALIAFYRGEYEGQPIPLTDDAHLLERFKAWRPLFDDDRAALVKNVLAMQDHWDLDLNSVPGLAEATSRYLSHILDNGVITALPK